MTNILKTFNTEHLFYEVRNNIAVEEHINGVKKTVTYDELRLMAINVASNLTCGLYSIQKQQPIIVKMHKGINYTAVLIGCMLARCPFIPIDINTPTERLNTIIKDSNSAIVIDDILANKLIIPYYVKYYNNTQSHYNDIAYIIYTSGSTGTPKGVEITWNGIPNLIKHQSEAFKLNKNSRVLWLLSNSFDGHLSDFFVTIGVGGTLVITDDNITEVYSKLTSYIKNYNITHVDMPPSVLKCIDSNTLPECLKTIIIGGEAVDIETAKRFADKVNLINVYGPTEATICTSLCKITKDWNKPLIGKPFDGVNYRIVNGELQISGCQLAKGYVNNKKLTDEKFISEKNEEIDNNVSYGLKITRWYKTGDNVRYVNNGNDIEFIGRIDRQFKYHGQLIAPEEIEAAYNALSETDENPCIINTVCKLINDEIVLFVEECPQWPDDAKIICRNNTPKTLSSYMIPKKIIPVKTFPRTTTGKIDYSKLTLEGNTKDGKFFTWNDCCKYDQNPRYYEFNSELEHKIALLFKELATNCDFMPKSNTKFKDIGDSIQAIMLLTQLKKRFNIEMTPNDLADNNTPELISKFTKSKEDTYSMKINDIIENIKKEFEPKISSTNKELLQRYVLFTGATGFLGSHLLAEYVKAFPYDKVICLVRTTPGRMSEKTSRLFVRLKKNKLTNEQIYDILSHIEAVPITSLSKPKLGMILEDYEKYAAKCSKVIHCAAEVNMFKTYDEMYDNNVKAVYNITEFCKHNKLKELHYASTLSVFVATDIKDPVLPEKSISEFKGLNVYGGYGQTKIAAELIIEKANIPHYMYRYGLLTAHTETYVGPTNDFLESFIQGASKIGSMPFDISNSLAVDITPVNYAVDTTVNIIKAIDKNTNDKIKSPHIYHVSTNSALKYNNITQILLMNGIITTLTTDIAKWFDSINRSDVCSNICALGLTRMNGHKEKHMDLFQATNTVFLTQNSSYMYNNMRKSIDQKYIAKMLLNFVEGENK